MNQAKFEAKLKGLNSQLRKVLDATPVEEPWMATAVSAEMRRLGSGGADSRATLGCLNSLLEMGLVEEVVKGQFRRAKVNPAPGRPPLAPPPEPAPAVADSPRLVSVKTNPQEEAMQTIKAVTVAPKSIVSPLSALDKLSRLAERLRELASDMESAALELAEQAEKDEAETAKMRQLQALLKSLG